MAIDQRHTQIKEGAGLEESRLNVEFIEWLRKWSTPLLIVIAAAALSYVLYHKYLERRENRANDAFASLESVLASANPNPASLVSVAEEYTGVRAVPDLARLAAADTLLAAVQRGVDPGASVGPDGKVASASDLMDEQEKTANLNEAARLYQAVFDECNGKPGLALHAIGSSFGLAAVAVCRGDLPAAKAAYERTASIAEAGGFPIQARIARERMAGLDARAQMPKLFEESELPKLPWAPEPPPPQSPEGTTPAAGGEPAPAGAQPPAVIPEQPAATPPATPTPTGGEPGGPPPP